jgi:hypothetical protein
MATSDLAAELGRDGFRFDGAASERAVAEAVLTQLSDTSGEIAAVANKW